MSGGHFEILERKLALRHAAQAHRLLAPHDPQALGLVTHREEAADAEIAPGLVEHAREDQMQPRDAAAGDPVLAAVDDVAVARSVGARRHRQGVRARVGLGDADRGLVAGEHQRRGELLLLVAAIGHHGRDRAHVGLDRDARRDGAALRHLLDDQHRVEERAALPAVRRGNRHADEARLGQRLHDVPGILLARVDLGGARMYDGPRERAGAGLQAPSSSPDSARAYP